MAQLCLPLLGQLHELSHGSTPAQTAALAMAERADGDAAPALQDLFGAHSAADCQWYGHLALGDGLWSHGASAPLQALAFYTAPAVYALLLRQSPALFFARGPPRIQMLFIR